MTKKIDRRQALRTGLQVAGLGALGLPSFSRVYAQGGKGNGRLLHIFLDGAWNVWHAIDPVVGDKRTSGGYSTAYLDLETRSVPGKSRLIVGPGLLPALPAFASVPTAFVNGIRQEIIAHEIGQRYMMTGSPLDTGIRGRPSLAPLAGLEAGGFPAHVVIGERPPLAQTVRTAPFLQSTSGEDLGRVLRWYPYTHEEVTSSDATEALIAAMDRRFLAGTGGAARAQIEAWDRARTAMVKLRKDYEGTLAVPPALKKRYDDAAAGDPGKMLACAFMAFRTGLTRFVTVTTGGFDTHTNDLASQIPRQQRVARALAVLVEDLRATPDPSVENATLADTTTIVITSEFTRTPKLNGNNGSDHWPTAAAIVMGRGVNDGTVLGATDTKGKALGWVGGSPVAITGANGLMPEHVAAAVVRHLGFGTAATDISEVELDGLFV